MNTNWKPMRGCVLFFFFLRLRRKTFRLTSSSISPCCQLIHILFNISAQLLFSFYILSLFLHWMADVNSSNPCTWLVADVEIKLLAMKTGSRANLGILPVQHLLQICDTWQPEPSGRRLSGTQWPTSRGIFTRCCIYKYAHTPFFCINKVFERSPSFHFIFFFFFGWHARTVSS